MSNHKTDQDSSHPPNHTSGGYLLQSEADRLKAEHAEEKRRENKYRKLQLWFNGILMLATIVTAVVVLYQNRILNLTLGEIKRQSVASESAAKSAEKSVALTQKAIETSIEGSRLEQRAWVGVKGIQMKRSVALKERFELEIVIENAGKTPGRDVHVNRGIKNAMRHESELDPKMDPKLGPGGMFVVAPGNHFTSTVGTDPMIQKDVDALQSGKETLYVYGTIHYRDILDARRKTTFCTYYVHRPAPSLQWCPKYNRME